MRALVARQSKVLAQYEAITGIASSSSAICSSLVDQSKASYQHESIFALLGF
jgi:hypothetical protein